MRGSPTSRHVLVTGAAGGIGRAVAEAFAEEPTTELTLVDVDRGRLAEAARALGAAQVCADLAGARGPAEAVRRAWDARGGVDVLVNAAGVYPSLDMIDLAGGEDAGPEGRGTDAQGRGTGTQGGDTDAEGGDTDAEGGDAAAGTAGDAVGLWDRIFALNTRAPALATAALARRAVAASRPASVVNISSGAALRARPGGGPYAASKAALEMATRASALELGPYGIRVNAVSPGFVPVDSDCNPVAPRYAAAVSANPLGRTGTPRDVALAVRWIAGEEAAWVTGEILRVDGGSGTGAGHLPRLWPPQEADAATGPPPHAAQGGPANATPQDTEGSTV